MLLRWQPGHKDTRVPGCWDGGMPRCRNARMPGCHRAAPSYHHRSGKRRRICSVAVGASPQDFLWVCQRGPPAEVESCGQQTFLPDARLRSHFRHGFDSPVRAKVTRIR